MRLILVTAACALSLAACQKGSGDGSASDRAVEAAGGQQPAPADPATRGAAGATTGPANPDPTGAGAMQGATPGDATGSLDTTPTEPPPSTPPAPK